MCLDPDLREGGGLILALPKTEKGTELVSLGHLNQLKLT